MISNFEKLLHETAKAFDVTEADILGPTRHKTMALARQVVMALWSDHHAYQDATNRCKLRIPASASTGDIRRVS